MDLNPYIASLREDLATTASAGDEQTRRAAALLAASLDASVRLALMNALSDLAAEVTAALDDHVVDVRLDGRDVKVVVTGTARQHDEREEAREPRDVPPPLKDGDMSRMTLRLVEELKARAERAASDQGVSLNTFVQQAVHGALHSGHQTDRESWHEAKRQLKQWKQQNWEDTGSGGSSRVRGWTEG